MDVIFKEGMLYLQGVKFGKVSFIEISQIQQTLDKVIIVPFWSQYQNWSSGS